jgi:hypothetical protein
VWIGAVCVRGVEERNPLTDGDLELADPVGLLDGADSQAALRSGGSVGARRVDRVRERDD